MYNLLGTYKYKYSLVPAYQKFLFSSIHTSIYTLEKSDKYQFATANETCVLCLIRTDRTPTIYKQ